VEQEAQLRLMEQIRNFSGKPSLLALRPADAAETSVAWKMAMDNHDTPTALILSRQDIPDLPAPDGTDRYTAALGALQGGYTVIKAEKPDVVLVANGSEVSLLCDIAVQLEAAGIHASVVSMPSIGLFNVQPADYRATVLPAGVPQFGLTAGLPVSLRMIEGFDGRVFGLERFGASAPYKVLDEKFGFTTRNIMARVCEYLGREVIDLPR
ncbi:MAG: transketolase, partial [Muribaculaceae bacterium]|nr:transketolase [Muribaculaceae bacterium]